MKNMSLSSVIGFLLSLPAAGFTVLNLYHGFSGYGAPVAFLFGVLSAALSLLFCLIALFYIWKGYKGKTITIIALFFDATAIIVPYLFSK